MLQETAFFSHVRLLADACPRRILRSTPNVPLKPWPYQRLSVQCIENKVLGPNPSYLLAIGNARAMRKRMAIVRPAQGMDLSSYARVNVRQIVAVADAHQPPACIRAIRVVLFPRVGMHRLLLTRESNDHDTGRHQTTRYPA